jgi:hypothetical protein
LKITEKAEDEGGKFLSGSRPSDPRRARAPPRAWDHFGVVPPVEPSFEDVEGDSFEPDSLADEPSLVAVEPSFFASEPPADFRA